MCDHVEESEMYCVKGMGLRSWKPVVMLVPEGRRAVEVKRSVRKPRWKSERVKASERRGKKSVPG